jgi:tetratricopeptide (TPR) repeat protein
MAQVPAAPPEHEASAGVARELGARQHFDRALELYRAGRYASARDELAAAAELDPNGKDLFFNLALVEEKLGRLDQAIVALQRFRALEDDPGERARALGTIERLRGAQRAAPGEARAAPCPEPAAAPAAPNAVLIGSASLAVAALAVGAVFGVKALNDDVGDQQTSSSLSVAQLRERAMRAEREALVADVAFAVAAASAGTFVCVWLLSPSQPPQRGALLSVRGRF